MNRMGDVRDAISLTSELNALEKALPGYGNELFGLGRNLPAGEGSGAITVKSTPLGTYIHADNVALTKDPSVGNSVDHYIVYRDASASGVSCIVQE